MRILVTGGIGNVGTETVRRLRVAGHSVRVIGRRPGMSIEGAEYAQCDVTDMDRLRGQVKGMDAIVHLAALPGPSHGTPETVFRVNCQGVFNVYQAAAQAGIRRIVTASSINALGFRFGVREFRVEYLPIDEEHPRQPTDAYSFSKNISEDIADYHWRRDGISGVCLRLPAIVPAVQNQRDRVLEIAAWSRREVDAFLALSELERREQFARWMKGLAEARVKRLSEQPPKGWMGVFPGSLMELRADFWASLDERDCAQAVEKGLSSEYEGNHVVFVCDSNNLTGIPSRLLAEIFYPDVKTWKKKIEGTETLVSIERARKLLGFEPEYSVNRFAEEYRAG